ncbi:MAG: hypothetical protein ABFD54_02840 [Armatimonadota bacterium]
MATVPVCTLAVLVKIASSHGTITAVFPVLTMITVICMAKLIVWAYLWWSLTRPASNVRTN